MKISKLSSLLVALLLAGFLAPTTSAQQQYRVGDIVEDFELIDRATNQPVKLSELEGHIIFLEWFTWWCPFCRAAAAEIGPGIATYYENEDGNPNGVPVKHIGINMQSEQETDTEAFVRFYQFGQVLNDFNRELADRFQVGGQPIFAIINGVKDSPSHQQWKLLYTELGYGELEFPIQTFRSRIDAVMAGTDPEPEPEPEPEETTAPTITRQPAAQSVAPGNRAELIVAAEGEQLTYQWMRNGNVVPGAIGARLVISNTQSDNTGSFRVTITNSGGSVTSESVQLSLTSGDGRLVNLSSRAFSGTGIEQLVPSFVANGSMRLLVRAVGPTLADFGVSGVLADPQFGLTSGQTVVAENNDWSVGSTIEVGHRRWAGSFVGAFALREGSKDAALLYTYDGGPRTAPVTDVNGSTGSTLVEVYEVPDETRTGRLANLAARGLVPSGQPLVAGFVLGGHSASTLLIRGVGPELGNFGVGTALEDPQISIAASNGVEFVSNDDWSSDAAVGAQIASIGATAGAFALTANSADAALLITLSPGAYTVQVTGKNGASGIVLAEIYDVTDL